ncbi:hypothetical protein M1247_02995 [Mycobacterium sp. 21AC1]|uniref:hypothetical protein n=1 Tax=[Mycobacterium] appelbergii TaxID=2939269 RepID=UPI002938D518|nr:hypothetical protein [Mycobacterium sp. 21AC1]MDV3123874.1 hypothetical protein [Mycobacterium sp. 21AC1]
MSPTELRHWPADPASAWAQAVTSPMPIARPGEPPQIKPLEEIAAKARQQRVFVPTVALVFTVVGAVVVVGLLAGVFPLSGRNTSADVQWVAGPLLLIAGPVLWIAHRSWRTREERRGFPPARGVLCEVYPTKFHVHDGDGYCLTSVAIDARTSDGQATKISAAFSIWLARLDSDEQAGSEARDAWQAGGGKGIANVYGSEEFFGPEAAGGYLVRGTVRRSPWALLLDWRVPGDPAHPLRCALVLAVDGKGCTP